MIIEVIATCMADVLAAEEGGADRIELITGISEGGLTPSLALVRNAVRGTSLPVNVMVRPHARSFVYDAEDAAVILEDIGYIRQAGAAGIVFGALTPDGSIDGGLLEAVLEARGEMSVTFHRAFDELEDQLEGLRQLTAYSGVDRILTSGGRLPAPQAVPALRALAQAAEKTSIRIMGGYGLTLDNAAAFVRETGVKEVHFGSAVRFEGKGVCAVEPARIRRLRELLKQ
jgi:copper homeostasis protein